MIDKTKEKQYHDEAKIYVDSVIPLEEGAKAIGWIGYGLDMREAEVKALKDRIVELGG